MLTKRHALTSSLPLLSQPLPSILLLQLPRAQQLGHPDQPEVITTERNQPSLCEKPLTPVALAAIADTLHLLPRTSHAQHNTPAQFLPPVILPPDAQTSSPQRSLPPSNHSPVHSPPPLQLSAPHPGSLNRGLTPQLPVALPRPHLITLISLTSLIPLPPLLKEYSPAKSTEPPGQCRQPGSPPQQPQPHRHRQQPHQLPLPLPLSSDPSRLPPLLIPILPQCHIPQLAALARIVNFLLRLQPLWFP